MPTRVSGFHHVALTVRDLDAAAAWYRRLFDLETVLQEPGDNRRAVVFRFPGTGQMLGLVEHANGSRDAFRFDQLGLDHVAFAVPQRADLDGWARRLDGEGIAHSGVIDIPSGAILNFKDPDGIALALFWDRDTSG